MVTATRRGRRSYIGLLLTAFPCGNAVKMWSLLPLYIIGKALFLLIQLLRRSEYVIHFLFFKAEEAEDIDDQSGPSNSRKRVARTENSYREVPTKRLKPTPSQVMMERFNKVFPHLDSFPYLFTGEFSLPSWKSCSNHVLQS